ncbi:MAG: glycoside hydrolase family 3 C-terminal domain-containing protein [Elusimicrobiales bacterium]|nr:glycoside hydrolase family 3 C-terminal domain-containing protein [Elusimicrobiales bacterium]
MKRLILTLLIALPSAVFASEPVYKDPSAPVEARVTDLLGRMTLDEKIDMISGVNDMDIRPNARLGTPPLHMTDGPLGVRDDRKNTAFPSGILSGASFDTALMGKLAAAMGTETLAQGHDMLLGPCVNIARSPLGGRNFESFGEDPYLSARMAESYVTALQGKKVLASTKHFALNNQEARRMTVDARAGERTMHEIYLPAFLAAVRAGTWTVMSAYNKINGHHASENDYLQNQVLKNLWGFKGFVVSDWGAVHSTVEAANGGLDVEMPSGEFFGGGKLQQAVREGKVSQEVIDDKVRRILRVMFTAGIFERRDADRPPLSAVNSPEHQALALRMAQEGIVLLKNDGILPLDTSRIKTVAVIGPNAAEARTGGAGSSKVSPFYAVSALEGLRNRAGKELEIRYARGVKISGDATTIDSAWLSPPPDKGAGPGLFAEYFNGTELEGKPVLSRVEPEPFHKWSGGAKPADGLGPENFSMRWTGALRVPKDGNYNIATRTDDGARLWIDGKLVIDDWSDHAPVIHSRVLSLKADHPYDIRLEFFQRAGGAFVQLALADSVLGEIPKAVEAAKSADAALVFLGVSDVMEGEGIDRETLELPNGQEELLNEVLKANKNTVVVLQAGSPLLMSRWADKVKAIAFAWYPGQEGGHAIADVLLGRVNPSGKLPVTFPKRIEDTPSFGNFPGTDNVVNYAEGIFVGYRHYDSKKVEPQYPFGYGLSYTNFAYSNIGKTVASDSAAAPEMEISVDVKNTGDRAGAEVAQLYVHDETPQTDRPEQELKGFSRVELAPGETKRVSFKLAKDAFAFYDEKLHDWRAVPERYELRVGASSRDIRLTEKAELK